MAVLTAKCALDMDCPKEVVVWNYYDHEHVVGTHYKYYSAFKILAERDDWCLIARYYKLPIIRLRTSSIGFMYMESPNLIRSIQHGKLGLVLDQRIQLDDLDGERCRVTCSYTVEVPGFARVFQPLFQRVLAQWFHDTWVEDAPMRLRRWKMWKLGFRDFRGLDYVNQKTARPAGASAYRPYPVNLPVPKTPESPPGSGYKRPFDESVEVGYRD
jgi:hypothetical protein